MCMDSDRLMFDFCVYYLSFYGHRFLPCIHSQNPRGLSMYQVLSFYLVGLLTSQHMASGCSTWFLYVIMYTSVDNLIL